MLRAITVNIVAMKQAGDQFKDIEGNVLSHQHTSVRPSHAHLGDMDEDDLQYEYQVLQVQENGKRELNSLQQHLGHGHDYIPEKTRTVLPLNGSTAKFHP